MKSRILSLVFVLASLTALCQGSTGYQRPPEEIAKLVEAPLTPAIGLSPDKSWMVLMDRSDYPTIEELSRPELRIAGLRINPDNFGPSRNNFFIGLKFKNLKDMKESQISGLPSPMQMSNFSFSPDSKKAIFLQTYADRIELWMVDLATMSAKALTKKKINTTLANGPSWLSNSSQVLFLAAVTEGKSLPQKTRVPAVPVIEEKLGRKAPSRTYQGMLENLHDRA